MLENTVTPRPKKPVEFLQVDLDCLTKDLEIGAKTELFEDENTRDNSLKLLRSMLEKEENLHWQNDDFFILAFLRAKKFDVQRAFNLMKGFYNNFGKYRHICLDLNADLMLKRRILEEKLFFILPYRDSQNAVIAVIRCCPWDLDLFSAEQFLLHAMFAFTHSLRSASTQIAGFKLIADFKGFTVRHCITTALASAKFFANMIQNALPFRMKGCHIVNENHYLTAYLWPFIEFFFSRKLRERVHLHGKDLKSLQKFFHPSILPAELGGELPASHYAEWCDGFEASADYIEYVLSFGYEKYLGKERKKRTEEKEK